MHTEVRYGKHLLVKLSRLMSVAALNNYI